jgi:hypothetical protein
MRVGLDVGNVSKDDDGGDDDSADPKNFQDKIKQNERFMIFPPASLLSKDDIRNNESSDLDQTSHFQALSQRLSSSPSSTSNTKPAYIVCLLMQSGRFAGGVFQQGKCVAHRTSTHYTVRKGQGKAQSTQDGNRRPKSMGSQLRRAGEQSTKEDIQSTLKEWKIQFPYIDDAALIFISCPKTMRSVLFFNLTDSEGGSGGGASTSNVVLAKDDDRIRKIPFDVGRPTYENIQVVHDVMTSVDVCSVPISSLPQRQTTSFTKDYENEGSRTSNVPANKKTTRQDPSSPDETAAEQIARLEKLKIDLPLTPLHEAARDGNLEVLLDLLKKMNGGGGEGVECDGTDVINQPAGYDCMTPLHYAAESTSNVDPVTAAACVSAILIQGSSSDPTKQDARGRVPYFLATHDKVREAFRKARAILGEEYCNWDKGAKVGPPLTDDDLNARKEKEAEKKRRKKAKQKEQKAKERSHAEAMEERRKLEEEEQRKAEEAKRIRDGLNPRPTGSNVCDFCQKECKGKRRNQMFTRLEYKYCSADCVNNHKRELMARAAMARFGQ